jgi:cytosine/adenosine deaminase-related metal-dependent hydrolase
MRLIPNHANGYTLNSKNELARFASLAFDDNGRVIAVGRADKDFDQLYALCAVKLYSGWHAGQAMTLKEAFRCFTLDAAYAAHQENALGSLEKGKWADCIVVDQDLFIMPAKDIHKTGVLQTWVAGRQV